jgi:hypothetical protein
MARVNRRDDNCQAWTLRNRTPGRKGEPGRVDCLSGGEWRLTASEAQAKAHGELRWSGHALPAWAAASKLERGLSGGRGFGPHQHWFPRA